MAEMLNDPIAAALAKQEITIAPPSTDGVKSVITTVEENTNALVTEVVSGAPSSLFDGGGGRLVADPVRTARLDSSNGGNDPDNIDYRLPFNLRWLERVQNYSPWNDVFSMEQQETQLVIDVPFENRYYFIPYCLGFAWVEDGRLRRINPIQHPYWSWMRACRVAHIGVRYNASKQYVNAIGRGSTFGVARYKLARFTITFANHPWDFLEDEDIKSPGDEWMRNVYWEEEPTAQMLAAEGGSSTLKFAFDTSGPGELYGPKNNTSFRAQFGTPVGQIRYILHWKHVPYDYVFYKRVPTNLHNAIMKLNATTAFGTHPAGTCLFDPPRIVKYVYPVRTKDQVAYMCDISIPYTYMNPTRGIDNVNFEGDPRIANVRGHNLCPYRENGYWYPAIRSGKNVEWDENGNLKYGLFQYHEWRTMFTQPTDIE